MNLRQFIYKYLWWTYRPVKNYVLEFKYNKRMKYEANRLENLSPAEKRIFYLGITAHSNLGDMAQHYCIKKWIQENFEDFSLELFEADPVVCKKYNFIQKLKKIIRSQDIIVFQSGYTTQDLGGVHNLMHEVVVQSMPKAKILMMPQTVFFEKQENMDKTGEILNSAKHMLFLARDFVSFKSAQQMMPNVPIEAFPDIVTTLIGTFKFKNKRNGVCLCTRNDEEKFYSSEEINKLEQVLLSKDIYVKQKDTQCKKHFKEIRNNLEKYIGEEIESYSRYQVTITDRYHGTIFSLCAGTPVIIIKTNDHKVTTGADWFKGVYDDYVYVAENLDIAVEICQQIIKEGRTNMLHQHFNETYYKGLKHLFFEKIQSTIL